MAGLAARSLISSPDGSSAAGSRLESAPLCRAFTSLNPMPNGRSAGNASGANRRGVSPVSARIGQKRFPGPA